MKSRERVSLALNHKEADRIPIDLGGTCVTTLITTEYNKLRRYLGINNRLTRMHNFNEQLGYPEKEFFERFPFLDVIDCSMNFLKSDKNWKKFPLSDGTSCLIPKWVNLIEKSDKFLVIDNKGFLLAVKPKNSLYVRQTYWALEDFDQMPEEYDFSEINKNMWASITLPPLHLNVFDNKQNQVFVNNIKELYETDYHAISLLVGCGLFEPSIFVRGLDKFLMDLYSDKKSVNKLLDQYLDGNLQFLEKVIASVGKYVNILVFSDDMGHNIGPFMGPDIFKEFFKPRYKKMYEYVHNNSNCKIFLHCCGSIMEIIPHLIDAGLDILNPVQTDAVNMDAFTLKKEFGRDLTFWGGGVDTRHILPFGTPKEVKEDVKRRIDIFSKNGGFVFAPIHNIQSDVPAENVIAMLEAAYEFGFYKK